MKIKRVLFASLFSFYIVFMLLSCSTENLQISNCTISYISEHGKVYSESRIVPKGYKIQNIDLLELTDPDFKFLGWFYKDTIVNVGKIVNEDITLIGKWDAIEDLVAPGDIEDLSIKAGNNFIDLNWKNPIDKDFYGIEVSASPSEGTLAYPVILQKEATSFHIAGLSNNCVYKFKMRTFDNNFNYSSGVSIEGSPKDYSDKFPPSELSELNIKSGDGCILLNWKNPNESDFYGVEISSVPPEGTLENPIILNKNTDSFNIMGLVNDKNYLFKIRTIDNNFNYSSGVTGMGVPKDSRDKIAPSEVSELNITNGDGEILLNWKNPNESDFYGIEISSIPTDGTLSNPIILNKNTNSFNITGLTNDKNYLFKVRTIDNSFNYSMGVKCAGTPKDSKDKIPPAEISELAIKNLDGKVAVTWNDPIDKDLFAIEVSYRRKDQIKMTSSMTENSIMISPKTQYVEIPNLINDVEYIFTIKTVDFTGNKSMGQSKSFIPSIIEGELLQVTLKPSTTEYTLNNIDISVIVENARKIKTVKWANGQYTSDDFLNNGEDITKSLKFNIGENGIYSVFVQDIDGRRETKQIKINNIVTVIVETISNFNATYNEENSRITLTWEEPVSQNYKDVEISYGQKKALVPKGTTYYNIENIPIDSNIEYHFTAITRDIEGNQGKPATVDIIVNTKYPEKKFNLVVSKADYTNIDSSLANKNGVYPVHISWDEQKSISGYNIYRSSNKNLGFVKLNKETIKGNFYNDNDNCLKPGEIYYYKVLSLDSLGNGNNFSECKNGWGALTHEQYFKEFYKTITYSHKKLTLMHKPGSTDKLGTEVKNGCISGTVYYNATVQDLGVYVTIKYTDYADYYIDSVDKSMGIKFVLNGNIDTNANMSSNGSMNGIINCTGMYPGKVDFSNIQIKSGAAGGGTYRVTPEGFASKDLIYSILEQN